MSEPEIDPFAQDVAREIVFDQLKRHTRMAQVSAEMGLHWLARAQEHRVEADRWAALLTDGSSLADPAL